MKHKKIWLTLLLLAAVCVAGFIIYQLNCFTCASGGLFSYGAPLDLR